MTKREEQLFTSDTHFHHVNIIDYCARSRGSFKKADGQPDTDAMNEALIANWNAVVPPGATVYHLGDFAFKPKSRDPGEIVKRLNGDKVLVWGNHDLLKGKKDEATRQFWLSKGFRDVVNDLRVEVDGKKLFLHHEPMPGSTWSDCDVHLCGHVHDAWSGARAGNGLIINVGVDVQGMTPRTLEHLLAWTPMRPDLLPASEFMNGLKSS